MTALEIPDEVVRMNLSANGAAGQAWLGSLPGLVDELTDRWSLTIGPAFTGGALGFVAPAERHRFRTVTRSHSSAISRRAWRTSSPGDSIDRIGPSTNDSSDGRSISAAASRVSSEEAVLANRDFHP